MNWLILPVRPHLIGIAGPSCSGKSEIASDLATRLRAPVLSLDHYYRDLSGLSLERRAQVNFDEPDSLDHGLLLEQVASLAAGETIRVPLYDFARHTRSDTVDVLRPTEHVLIEGLFALYWADVRHLLGTGVFVDAPDEVCLERRIERDVRLRGRTEASVRAQFAATVRPMCERHIRPTRHYADVVVRGTEPIAASSAAVWAHAAKATCAPRAPGS